ncbi:MAG: plasmid pRiA4b ORF-3 family protein [Deltaproteobacteria bacterium]|jgi:hypothetical protein|nr:plasmid pRiA4b ORF-3 family protein [Deltaproteobacteria bacterium]
MKKSDQDEKKPAKAVKKPVAAAKKPTPIAKKTAAAPKKAAPAARKTAPIAKKTAAAAPKKAAAAARKTAPIAKKTAAAAPKKAAAAAKKPAIGVPLYAFRVELRDVRPKVWRYFYVPSNINLAQFHRLVQEVMGWSNCHLYSFTIFGQEFYHPDEDYSDSCGEDCLNPAKTKLNRLGLYKGARFRYLYDMGDSWEHVIKVLDTDFVPPTPGQASGCYKGARACPPEDCGGSYGYAELLEVLGNPKHEDHEDMMEWTGGGFDPEEFDLGWKNRALQRVASRFRTVPDWRQADG